MNTPVNAQAFVLISSDPDTKSSNHKQIQVPENWTSPCSKLKMGGVVVCHLPEPGRNVKPLLHISCTVVSGLVLDGGVKFDPNWAAVAQRNTTQCGHCWGWKDQSVCVCLCVCVAWQAGTGCMSVCG